MPMEVMRETRVQSPGREDPLKKRMTSHSRILAWRVPWTEEPGGLQSMGSQESNTTEQLHFYSTSCISVCNEIYKIQNKQTP